jgi:hypothetical protein
MIGRTRTRLVTGVVAAVFAAGGMLWATTAPALAGTGSGYDPTGGAYAAAGTSIASNGGTYVGGWVFDAAADGKCAHAAVRWLHKNGNYYYDYGLYTCGNGSRFNFTTNPRNATLYRKVDLQVFVDNGPVSTYPLATF